MYRGKYYTIDDFSGGMVYDIPATNLAPNQMRDIDNMVLKPGGKGIRSRLGNTAFNSTAMNSGANVQGVGYFLKSDSSEFLVAVAGARIYKSDSLDGTMDDITDTYADITAGQDNTWSFITFNDTLIGFGGPEGDPDPAIKWTGTGNVAALGGSAPAAYGGLSANNRVFAYRTQANPSTIYWSVIGDSEDWSGAGSGSAVIGSLSDNEKITAAEVISTNYMLIFKETSTHQMVISQAPFPVYSLFDTVGCVGKDAVVNIDGRVYFIAQNRRMYSTDGHGLQEYPGFDGMWDYMKTGEDPYIKGVRLKGSDYDLIVWLIRWTLLDDNDGMAYIWDLKNNCWGGRFTSGFSHNSVETSNNGTVYFGGYDGKIYKPFQASTYTDASESGAAITSYARSGWLNPEIIDKIVQVRKITVIGNYKASGTVTIKYGFDGVQEDYSGTVSQTRPLTTGLYFQRPLYITGRGNTFSYTIYNSSDAVDVEVYKLILAGKVYGQKDQEDA